MPLDAANSRFSCFGRELTHLAEERGAEGTAASKYQGGDSHIHAHLCLSDAMMRTSETAFLSTFFWWTEPTAYARPEKERWTPDSVTHEEYLPRNSSTTTMKLIEFKCLIKYSPCKTSFGPKPFNILRYFKEYVGGLLLGYHGPKHQLFRRRGTNRAVNF